MSFLNIIYDERIFFGDFQRSISILTMKRFVIEMRLVFVDI